jgi:RNA polymerase sigma factor for flagellar operon FliA
MSVFPVPPGSGTPSPAGKAVSTPFLSPGGGPVTTKDAATMSKLVESCQGLVYSEAWQWRQRVGRRVELDDLIAYGQMALVEAAQRFDESRGVRFVTFAYERVRGAMRDGLRQMGYRPADVDAAKYQRLGRDVVAPDSTSDAGENASDAAWMTDVGARLAIVYLASNLGPDGPALEAVADADAAAPEEEADLREARAQLREEIKALPRQEQELVQALYFEGLSLIDAAERLGIQKSWASRLHQRALRTLARGLRRAGRAD